MNESESAPPMDEEHEAAQQAALDSLAITLAQSRTEAVDGRKLTGIEEEWLEDDEFYEGIDDANRSEYWRSKPAGQAALQDRDAETTSSTIFLNITRPYVDAASARVGDMLLPTDDRGWSIGPTPVPELGNIAKGKLPSDLRSAIQADFQGQPDQAQAMADKLIAQAKEQVDIAKGKAEKATKRIEDWHVECQYHAHVRQVIEDAARLGTGCLKGPIPVWREAVAYKEGQLLVQKSLEPASLRIDIRNLFPDPGCGTNVHNGAHIWERDDITGKQIAKLRGAPGYIDSSIRRVLDEGPSWVTASVPDRPDASGNEMRRDRKNLFEIWYYHGVVPIEDLACAGIELDIEDDGTKEVAIQATLVNNQIIRIALNPLDTGDFPYDIFVWQRRAGMPWGIGVGRQIRNPQRIVNGAGRMMMDNAGRAGGPQVVHSGAVTPMDGVYEITSWKQWRVSEDFDVQNLQHAFQFVAPEMYQAELQAIIMLGLKLAEDVTGMPMLMQGQMGQKAPNTLGGMEMLSNNASTVLRRIARLFDDLLTEPHVRRYYAYLLQHGKHDDEKGDLVIDARGSSALVERDLQSQAIPHVLEASLNPVFKLDPAKSMQEYLKSQKLDVKRFDYDDEEWQKVVEGLSQPAPDPAMAVAELRAETERFRTEVTERIGMAKIETESQDKGLDRVLDMSLAELKSQIDTMSESGKKEMSAEQVKSAIAQTVMKLKTQVALSDKKAEMEALTPPTEPAQHAPDGKAFAQ